MPRSYGRTATSIWRDKDFRQLSPEARFTYVMLFNQATITATGVLGVAMNQWAGNTGYSIEIVQDALDELVKRDYIVLDPQTDELFVRSFVKWDGGTNNDLRRKAIKDAANAVASDSVRASIANTLDRLGVPHGLSIEPTDPFEARRVVVNTGDHQLDPQPSSATRESEPDPSDASDGPPSMFCSNHPNGTEKPCGPCGTAKLRYSAWVKSTAGREADRKAAAALARAECVKCDPDGWALDDAGMPTARKCRDHRRSA